MGVDVFLVEEIKQILKGRDTVSYGHAPRIVNRVAHMVVVSKTLSFYGFNSWMEIDPKWPETLVDADFCKVFA